MKYAALLIAAATAAYAVPLASSSAAAHGTLSARDLRCIGCEMERAQCLRGCGMVGDCDMCYLLEDCAGVR